jgi:hypothetical protein
MDKYGLENKFEAIMFCIFFVIATYGFIEILWLKPLELRWIIAGIWVTIWGGYIFISFLKKRGRF